MKDFYGKRSEAVHNEALNLDMFFCPLLTMGNMANPTTNDEQGYLIEATPALCQACQLGREDRDGESHCLMGEALYNLSRIDP